MPAEYLNNVIALTIHIKGLVQGVGFRPFIYRLALEHHLSGWVVNGTDGVTVKVEGMAAHMSQFVEDIRYKAPVVSQIDEMIVDQDMPEGISGFYILASQDLSDETSEISPDIAVCPDCLADMKRQEHRISYPFINCTNCGPRFSIIRDFPYDRAKTTMAPFAMCPVCTNEYNDVADRRFHAQPVACNNCGPVYTIFRAQNIISEPRAILTETADLISQGKIIALKGTGGFHLMCDALNENAVTLLRHHKRREGKPFAVMFRDLQSILEFAHVSEAEQSSLTSWRRPVVILDANKNLAKAITMGLNTIGAFLPYMPFHYLMFEVLKTPAVVLTSGNLTDEPIIIDNEEAVRQFAQIADAVITYNREIYNRSDDSVVRIMSEKERIMRRSRGYAPAPVRTGFNVDGILAVGAELSATFCLGKADRAYLSQHIGDLKNHETFRFYEEAQSRFCELFRVNPVVAAIDLHPDYLSTRFAGRLGIPCIQVQHHHAHIASCMAENFIDEPVIGIALDGTGYGDDGHIWGGEFMICDYSRYERHMHFKYMPLPGGDLAVEQPWRMGISLLYQAFGKEFLHHDIPLIRSVENDTLSLITDSIDKGINCPLSSGAGRLFDAVAAITGVCVHSSFHAEAPVRLESVIKKDITEHYPFSISDDVDFLPAIVAICDDLKKGTGTDVISAKFHNTVAEACCKVSILLRETSGISIIALSGGTFQNKYLSELLETMLVKNNFVVLTHSKVPCNDGGIALGQLVIASRSDKYTPPSKLKTLNSKL